VAVLEAARRDDPEARGTVDAGLLDPDPAVRATALAARDEQGRLDAGLLAGAMRDPDAQVRLRAAQLAARLGAASHELLDGLLPLLNDTDPLVAVAALVAIGDLEADDASAAVAELAGSSREPLVVEEAVATLGALGAEGGLEVILGLLETAKPALRRRCVAALSAYDGEEVEAALDRLAEDRDWQVRQAVAMLRREE
jgi:HEAT repeat protein